MNLVSLNKISPSLILRHGKILCVLGVGTIHTQWNNPCSSKFIYSGRLGLTHTSLLDCNKVILHMVIAMHACWGRTHAQPLTVINTLVTNVHDHRFLKFLIGFEMSSGLTLFCTRSSKIKVTTCMHVIKWMRKWHEILHVYKWIIIGDHLDFVTRKST